LQTESHHDFEQQQQYGAMIRALSGDGSAQIRDWHLYRKNEPFEALAPHLHLNQIHAAWTNSRGILDGIGLLLRYSDRVLHTSHMPQGMVESLIYEVLEQIRVESICPDNLKGCKQNIQTQFIAWMQQFITTGGVEGSIGLLLISVFASVWMKLNGREIPQLIQDIIEATRAGIASQMGPLLVELKAQQQNQSDFSKASLKVVDLVASLIDEEYRNNSSIRTKRKSQSSTYLKIEWVPPHAGKISTDFKSPTKSTQEQRYHLQKSLDQYRIYNSSYDLEVWAKKNIRAAQLAIYQEQLNSDIAKENIPWAKLIRIYQQLFSTTPPKRWRTTEAEGVLDRRYLIRAATAPLQPILHKQLSPSDQANAKVTILIDCSGSMKEQRNKIAICVDSLSRILEQAGIETEILGYSTRTWQGGRPFKEWRKNGQPPNPGRLNERAHWIFKDFDTNWRRSRSGIAALLRPEIYAESVDGEALLWATKRLQRNGGKQNTKKILILFSDGCPMDRATIEANGEEYLKNHLLQAISWCSQQTNLELWGCGIGEELRSHFPNRLSWANENGPISINLINWAKELKARL
jgi:cobaltochelatase CobT